MNVTTQPVTDYRALQKTMGGRGEAHMTLHVWKSHTFKSRSTCLSKPLYIKPNKNSVLTVQRDITGSEKNCVKYRGFPTEKLH